MKQNAKLLVYATCTAVVIAFSWWLQAGITLADAGGILRALGWLIVAGVLLVGVGIFLRRGADAVFADAAGGVTLAAALTLFLLYGGMDNTAAAGADTAANLLSCLWTALPLCFAVRTLVLAFGTREGSRRQYRAALLAAVVLLLWLAALIACGQLLHFQHLEAAV